MSNTNFVDYDVLEKGKQVYQVQSEAIADVMGALQSMNEELKFGWQNETARAFIEMYDSRHRPALQSAVDALMEISTYIQNYGLARKDEDTTGAAGLRG